MCNKTRNVFANVTKGLSIYVLRYFLRFDDNLILNSIDNCNIAFFDLWSFNRIDGNFRHVWIVQVELTLLKLHELYNDAY